MATTAKGMYPPHAHARGCTVGSFVVTAAASPTVNDPGGIVASVIKVPATTGQYLVTLKRNYSRVHAVSDNNSAGELFSRVRTVVAGGTVSNTILFEIWDTANDNPDDGTGTLTTLAFFGYDS
jgi:hypothetical protein